MARTTGATIMPILKIMYYGKWIAVWVISVQGNLSTSGGVFDTATKYVARTLPSPRMNPIKGNARPLNP